MAQSLEVLFPGGKHIDVKVGDHVVKTDQSVKLGGEGSAPEPFNLFLASMAACAGIYALNFCETRKLPTDGLGLSMDWSRDPEPPKQAVATLRLTLPEGFPERYRESILRAMDLCAVKKNIVSPPRFEMRIEN
jgi:ribosomal protein S12 methylthiotransferase accessory factor